MGSFQELKASLSNRNVDLVAVSKTKPIEAIQEIYNQGQRIFGENRVQELTEKHPVLPKDIEWHMIGHLQTNKVKFIAPFVVLIHAVDSIKLLKTIDAQALRFDRKIGVLLQLKVATEESKFGFSYDDLKSQLSDLNLGELHGVEIRGVMGMASFVSDTEQVRSEFRLLKNYFDQLKEAFFPTSDFNIISMGMSGDFEIAIEEGSTMVRIGSLIFGSRG